MKLGRQRLLYFLALAALLALFAGCKGESPTAPPATGTGGTGGAGNPPGGGITPPTGATLTLTVSNSNPLIDSVSTITANVSLNGQPVVNGTAVEFITSLGVFTDTQDVRTIRTTTNGVASAVLTSPDAGVATVSATVNNVTKTVLITFNEQPVTPTPPSTAPTISSVSPNTGPPAGGTPVTISGTNFRSPVRVIFDAGAAGSKEAFVQPQSVTPTSFVVVTPAINLTATQTQAASITVIVDAGSPTEQRVTRSAAFTYVTTNLTPIFRALSPGSGGIEGGTQITILGDAFDAAGGVQVFFGAAQAQIVNVLFNRIIVLSPTARDTAPNASGPVTGPVDLRIKNIASGKEVAIPAGFRYIAKAQMTIITPSEGPYTGGTKFVIDGTGFNEPIAVTLAGVGAQIIKVTDSQIQGISNPIQPTGCSDIIGQVVEVNGDNGDGATGLPWTYRIIKPSIVAISSPVNAGAPMQISVLNAVGTPSFTIGGVAAPISSAITNPTTGVTTFTLNAPTAVTFTTAVCPGITGVSAPQPTPFDVVFTSLESTCSTTAAKGVTINPVTPILAINPNSAFTPFLATSADPLATPPTPFKPSVPQTVLFVNAGGGNLLINGVTTSGAGCASFSISSGTIPSSLASCDPFPLTAQYTPPPASPPGTFNTCTVTVGTSLGNKTFILSGSVQ